MSDLNKLTKANLIKVVQYCHSMEHVADILLRMFNQSPMATNQMVWVFPCVKETGESEDFELMLRRKDGVTTTELLAAEAKKCRELEAENKALKEQVEKLLSANQFIFDPDGEGQTYPIENKDECCEDLEPGEIRRLTTYRTIDERDVWAAHVVLTRDEDGDPDDAEIQWFDTEIQAQHAVQGMDAPTLLQREPITIQSDRPNYIVGCRVSTVDENDAAVYGTVLAVGPDSITVRWDDLPQPMDHPEEEYSTIDILLENGDGK